MNIKIWGTRGSLPAPGPDNIEFGGNTSCVQVSHQDAFLVLDAGSGIRRLGSVIPPEVTRIDILLTHLHMDHIMGLGFFLPLYNPKYEICIWGPAAKNSLQNRLARYLSPPLFPVRLQDLPCQLSLMEISHSKFNIGALEVQSSYLCHPGPTVGYRISSDEAELAYMPDHEPNLGAHDFPNDPAWTSGYELAKEVDLLLHDAQYTGEEYKTRVGWGHSAMQHSLAFAQMTRVKHLMFFHHDPSHTDEQLKCFLGRELKDKQFSFKISIAAEGDTIVLPNK